MPNRFDFLQGRVELSATTGDLKALVWAIET